MNPYSQAQRWLDKQDAAVSGSGGHGKTFAVARCLVHGFSLSTSEVRSLMNEYNRRCQPTWSESEIEHKVSEAMKSTPSKPRGYMLRNSNSSSQSRKVEIVRPAKVPEIKSGDADSLPPLPPPMKDGARELLRSVFRQGEEIRIAKAMLNDEGREIPDGSGIVLSREEWLRKLDDRNGDPNGIFSSSKRTGIYISINPTHGARDADVTDLRHILIESDHISKPEQFRIYQEARLPCAAIIDSGGKSIHAWVRVDAKDRKEYDERRQSIYRHLEGYGFKTDEKNKNPNRFSRLPNCVRFHSRQELLLLGQGAESFTQWLVEGQTDDIGQVVTVDELMDFKPECDSNSVLGKRWLCKGGSLVIVGASGVGKSSLNGQMAITWAVGEPFFGITPVRPLKSLIVQAENDTGDMAEIVQGVSSGLMLNPFEDEQRYSLFQSNVIFVRDSTHTGFEFTEVVRRLIDKHRPDLVWLDPLLSFIGADISRQEVCSQFLRNWLNPISEATGVIWICVHHTGKPPKELQGKKEWRNNSDFSYAGMGSSELTNWTRAAMTLREVENSSFELKLAKRGKRAGATDIDGAPTQSLWLRHSDQAIRWEQVPAPAPRAPREGGRENKVEAIAGMNLHGFLAACSPDGEGKNAIARRLECWLSTQHKDVKVSTCKTIVERLVENQKLSKGADTLYRKGANA